MPPFPMTWRRKRADPGTPVRLPQSRSPSPSRGQVPAAQPGESPAQTIDRLSAELRVAKMAKIAAEREAADARDVLSGKEVLMETSEKQCEAAWEMVDQMKRHGAEKDAIIQRLKADAQHFPLSTPALMRSHHLLSTTFDTLRECFTCPLCYEGLAKGEAVSLQCGHTFCQNCLISWTTSRRPAGLSAPPGKTLANVECPECRLGTAHPSARRVRLYMLEEAVRLLARAEKERRDVEEEEEARRRRLEDASAPIPGPGSGEAKAEGTAARGEGGVGR